MKECINIWRSRRCMWKCGGTCGTSRGPIPAKITGAKKALHNNSLLPAFLLARKRGERKKQRRPFLSSPPPTLSRLPSLSPERIAASQPWTRSAHISQFSLHTNKRGTGGGQREHSSRTAVPACFLLPLGLPLPCPWVSLCSYCLKIICCSYGAMPVCTVVSFQ